MYYFMLLDLLVSWNKMHDLSTFDILFPKFYVWILEFHFVYKNRSLDRPTWTNFALLNVDMVPPNQILDLLLQAEIWY